MIIDKNTKGVKFNGSYYEFKGDLIADCLDIQINLKVSGHIEAGEWIEAGKWIKAEEWIEAGTGDRGTC